MKQPQSKARKIILITSFCFCIILTILLGISFFIPEEKKDDLHKYAIQHAFQQYNTEKNKLQDNDIVNIGLLLLGKSKPELADYLTKTDSIVTKTVASIEDGELEYFNELKALDASDRKKLLAISSLEDLKNPQFIKKYITLKYVITLEEIPREIRIFLICNILLFLVIVITTKLRNLPDRAIVIPSVLLFVSTIVSMYFYMFETHWLYLIVFNSYSRYGYLVIVLILFVLLNIFTFEARLLSFSASKEK